MDGAGKDHFLLIDVVVVFLLNVQNDRFLKLMLVCFVRVPCVLAALTQIELKETEFKFGLMIKKNLLFTWTLSVLRN